MPYVFELWKIAYFIFYSDIFNYLLTFLSFYSAYVVQISTTVNGTDGNIRQLTKHTCNYAHKYTYYCRILQLQGETILENLKSKWWNVSAHSCPSVDESKGLTFQTVGGVFLLTAAGMTVGLVVFAVELTWSKLRNKGVIFKTITHSMFYNFDISCRIKSNL